MATLSSRSATARTELDSLQPETFSLSAFGALLRPGANVLALHGLNASASDSSFYLAPTLLAGRSETVAPRYFRTTTPGGPNTATGVIHHQPRAAAAR